MHYANGVFYAANFAILQHVVKYESFKSVLSGVPCKLFNSQYFKGKL